MSVCADDDWKDLFSNPVPIDPNIKALCETNANLMSYIEVPVPAATAFVVRVSTREENFACPKGIAVPKAPFIVQLSESCISTNCPELLNPTGRQSAREGRRGNKENKKCNRAADKAVKAL